MLLAVVQVVLGVICALLLDILSHLRSSLAYWEKRVGIIAYWEQRLGLNNGSAETFVPNVVQRTLTTRDGVRLKYFVAFDSDGTKPLMLLCPHLRQYRVKMEFSSGHFVMMAFQHDFTFVTWEQRGNHGSTEPADPTHTGIDYVAQDGMEVMKAAGYYKAAVIFGHSQGVQIGLEMVCQVPTCADRLILCNGIHGRLGDYWAQIVPIPGMPHVLRSFIYYAYDADWLLRIALLLGRWTRPITMRMLWLLYYLLADRNAPDTVRLHKEFCEVFFMESIIGWKSLIRWLQKMDEHSTLSRLHTVKQPVLLLSGGFDFLTPCRATFDMARLLPNCKHHFEWTAEHTVITTRWTRSMRIIKDFLDSDAMHAAPRRVG